MLLMYDGSVQNNKGIFCRGRCTVVAKVQRGHVNAPSDLATTVTGHVIKGIVNLRLPGASTCTCRTCTAVWNLMRTVGLFQFMRFVCNLPRIMRLFDFGRNYAKNYASIIRQGLVSSIIIIIIIIKFLIGQSPQA